MNDELKWYRITKTLTGLIQAKDETEAHEIAEGYFDFTDLDYGRIEVVENIKEGAA